MTTSPVQEPGTQFKRLDPKEAKAAKRFAVAVYATIMGTFVLLCTIAVVASSSMEKEKQGFRAIEVKAPISFIDTTYLKKEAKKP